MMGILSITGIGAIIVALIACYTDVKTGKIFNWLTFPAAGVGIIARAIEYGMHNPNSAIPSALGGALNAIVGWLLAVLIMSLMKVFLKHMGHGDTKLMAALGAFIGPAMIFGTFFYYCASYMLYSAIKLGWTAVKDRSKLDEVRKQPHPVAPLITAGLLIALIFQQQTLDFFGINTSTTTPSSPKTSTGAPQTEGNH